MSQVVLHLITRPLCVFVWGDEGYCCGSYRVRGDTKVCLPSVVQQPLCVSVKRNTCYCGISSITVIRLPGNEIIILARSVIVPLQ